MQLLIPTYKRHDFKLARTLRAWPKTLPVTVVVQPQELEGYQALIARLELKYADFMVLPEGLKGIARTRDYIMKTASHKHICMIDDDLQFLIRRGEGVYLRGATDDEISDMFGLLDKWLNEHAHCAISMREGNNRVTEPFVHTGRGIRIVAYDRELVNKLGCRFREEVDTKEDLDMTLQLLRKGYPNRISFFYAQGQTSSNSPGGLSEYRDEERNRIASEALHALHPEFVRVVKKETKTAWGGGERTDVSIQWKKALMSSGVTK